MKPKIWKKLRVFGLVIPVFRVNGLLEDGAFGYYEDEHKFIAIDARLRGEDEIHTLIHELFHAALDRIHAQQQMPDPFAEIVVENLTVALLENFRVRSR